MTYKPTPTAPGSILYTLTPEERQRARRVGDERQHFHDQRGTPNTYNLPHNPHNDLRINRMGALAELAVATILGHQHHWIECTEHYQTLQGDIIPGLEVRSSEYLAGNLLLHPRDHDNRAYIYCRHHTDTNTRPIAVEIIGWTTGHQGKHPNHWWLGKNNNRPCYRIPTPQLNPGLRDLHQWLHTHHPTNITQQLDNPNPAGRHT